MPTDLERRTKIYAENLLSGKTEGFMSSEIANLARQYLALCERVAGLEGVEVGLLTAQISSLEARVSRLEKIDGKPGLGPESTRPIRWYQVEVPVKVVDSLGGASAMVRAMRHEHGDTFRYVGQVSSEEAGRRCVFTWEVE